MSKFIPNKLADSNNERFFRTARLKSELKQRSVRGGAVTILAQAGKFILQTGSTAVLARLLVPEDYGLIGMVTVFIGFAQLFKDLGLSKATIQKAEINHQQVSTLFWINLSISWLTALAVAAMSPLVAWFYNEPRLTWITLALASNFVFGGLTVQHQALLQRQMQFTSLAKIEITSMITGIAIAMVSAWFGLGYWALVLMRIAISVVNAVGVWIACGWRPGSPVRKSGIRSMLAFGGNITGFNLVNYFSRNLDNVLIGRYWGSQQLGLYAKAYQLVLLPINQINNPISSVALPALSSLQSEPKKYCQFYYKAMLLISSLGMPLIGFLFLAADKVILLMLGEQWLGTVTIFKFLLPAAFNATIGIGLGWAYQSLGHVARQFRYGVVASIINIVLFALGVRWGAIGVAAAYGLSRPIFLVAGFIYCFQGTPLKVENLISNIWQPALASLGAAIALTGINYWFPIDINRLVNLLINFIFYASLYIAIWIILPNGKQTFLSILKLSKTFKKK